MNRGDVLTLLHRKTNDIIQPIGASKKHLARCPAHNDKNPSLSVAEGNDGRVLLKCFAGCTLTDICAGLGIKQSDLFTEKRPLPSIQEKIEYIYRDEQGKDLYKKIRILHGSADNKKSFYYERTDDNGQIVRDLNRCRKVLYRLPELLESISTGKTIFLVEGEKDVETLLSYGLTATTTSHSLEWNDEFRDTLKDADIAVLYDMDKTGLKRRDLLCNKLFGHVKRLRIVDLPDLPYTESHGKDISDWLAMGKTIDQLINILDKTSDYNPANKVDLKTTEQHKSKIRVVGMDEFLCMKFPEREMILAPFLPRQGLVMIYAKRGIGKTHLALGIAYAVANGGSFLKWLAPRARKVLYIDGEMPAVSMQERLLKFYQAKDQPSSTPENLMIITPDLQDDEMPDLSTEKGRNQLNEAIKDCDLIIIDNISTLFRSGCENEAEGWQSAQDWALAQRRQGKSLIFVHHAGKGGLQRGTSKREDILDAVITLKNPDDYKPEQGARFEVHFEKARHFTGEDAMNFSVELQEQADDSWIWVISGNRLEEEVLLIVELKKAGSTIKEIVEKTGLSKSKIETRLKWAKERKLLN